MRWNDFLLSPRETAFRRVAFQIHLWGGLGIGLYVLVMSVTGAILVFQEEISASIHPEWYHVRERGKPNVTIDTLIGVVRSAFPEHRIYRIYAPTTRRDTYVVSIEKQYEFRTVFADPATGVILGSVPKQSFMKTVWEVHANLLGGTTGRAVNCTLGLFVVLLAASGLIVWWPGAQRWWRALGVSTSGKWTAITRGLHGAVGLWTFAFVVMFATTGAMYYFGTEFYRVLGLVSPLTNEPMAFSKPPSDGGKPVAEYRLLIAQAEAASPGKQFYGMVPPWSDKSPIRIVVGPVADDLGASEWEFKNTRNRNFYYDQYSGELMRQWDLTNATFADFVRSWVVPLHRGSFAGRGVMTVWVVVGLAPALLFVLGVLIWWKRVVSPRLQRRRSAAQRRSNR